jgi:hypothetical protein
MAKSSKKPAKGPSNDGRPPKLPDAALTGLTEALKKKKRYTAVRHGADTQPRIVGMLTPAVAFHYLLGIDVFPFGHMYYLAGQQQARKSTLCFEIQRWLKLQEGFSHLINTEGDKYSPSLHAAVMRRPRKDWNVEIHKANESLEQAHQALQFSLDTTKKVFRKVDGNKLARPVGFFLDSLEGTADAGTHEKVAEEGHASRNYAVSANLNTQFFKVVTAEFPGFPYFLVVTNHIKFKNNQATGQAEAYTPGGAITKYLETFEIHMSRVKDIRTKEMRGAMIQLKSEKNSFAENKRVIEVRVLYSQRKIDPNGPLDRSNIQKIVRWDWDHSLGSLVTGVSGARTLAERNLSPASVLKDYGLHFESIRQGDVDNAAWSETLGIKKDSPVSFAELGKMLVRERTDVLENIYAAWGIEQGVPFDTGMDFEKLAKRVERVEYDADLARAAKKAGQAPQGEAT